MGLRIYQTKDYQAMSRKAANIISAQVILKPECVLGLATGSTPVGAYQQLVDWYQKGDLDFSGVTTVNLDEYKGLDGENSQSYRYFMNYNLFDHVNVDKSRTFVPNGLEEDGEKECARYDQVVAATGGVDLQLLGLGRNGHIGFNEPCDEFKKGTHLVALSQNTIDANSRFFDSIDEVPKFAYPMGIRTIMQARKILMVVSGEDKAEAVRKSFFGPCTPEVPASILQMHPDVILVADEAALSQIADKI